MSFRPMMASDVRRLSAGSYEERARLRESLALEAADRLGVPGTPEVVATFDDRVVLQADGRFWTLRSKNDEFVEAVEEPVRTVDHRNVGPYLRAQALAAADAFLNGQVSESKKLLRDAMPFLPSTTQEADRNTLSEVLSVLDGPSIWRATYEARLQYIEDVVGQQRLSEIRQLSESEHTIEELERRLFRAHRRASKALRTMNKSHKLAPKLESFATDLVKWSVRLEELVESAREKLANLTAASTLRDKLASRLPAIEASSAFVEEAASRLRTESTTA